MRYSAIKKIISTTFDGAGLRPLLYVYLYVTYPNAVARPLSQTETPTKLAVRL